MFENLSSRFSKMIHNITKRGVLTEKNIQDILDQVRIALLEADVSYSVVDSFINSVKMNALGHIVHKGLTPSQEFVNIVYDSLVLIMGGGDVALNFSVQPPAVFLIVGSQGSGKTTTCAKLAKYLRVKSKKKVLVSSVDTCRPSGVRQLEILTDISGADFFQVKNSSKKKVIDIAAISFSQAKLGAYDVLLIDTAGCLPTDINLMSSIADLSRCLNPVEILFVVDAMLGQESSNIVSVFSSKLSLTGVIITKIDGDSRGGVALSIYHTIHKPIKFIGTGEKIDALEPFHASRMARRILGMGDVLSLVEDIKDQVKNVHTQHTLSKLKRGDSFDLSDFLSQLKQMRNMGGISHIISKLPIDSVSNALKSNMDDKSLMTMEVIINSMTLEERKYPQIIQGSRKKRISCGSGVSVQEINTLLQRFEKVQFIMKKISKNGLSKVLYDLRNKFSL